MRANDFVDLLSGVRVLGPGKWQAKCPAHEDKRASLSIGLGQDGRILLKCHAGCEVAAIVAALRLTEADLFADETRAPARKRLNRRGAEGDEYTEGTGAEGKGREGKGKVDSRVRGNDGEVGAAPRKSERDLGPIIATYNYVNASGELVYQVTRHDPKDFRQRRPDGKGGWIWNLTGIERVPFRLPKCVAAIRGHKAIFVVEGEKDALALGALGLAATTNAGGAEKWTPELSEALAGAHLVILPDNDKPGWSHAALVAALSVGLAASIRIIGLEGLAAKGDVSDWLAAGHTKAELIGLARAAEDLRGEVGSGESRVESGELGKGRGGTRAGDPGDRRTGAGDPGDQSLNHGDPGDRDIEGNGDWGSALTDLGNAEALIAEHGDSLRFCIDRDKFLIWDGCRWAADETGEIQRRATETIRAGYERLRDASPHRRDGIYKHLVKSENAQRLNAMETLARYVSPATPVRASELDADGMVFNVRNGTIDLRTGELKPHRNEDLITKMAPVSHNVKAKCDRWTQFLSEVFDGDQELVEYVRRIAGYCLTGSIKEQCLFILLGKGGNGKTVLVETMRHLLGDYGSDSAISMFTERPSDTSTVGLAMLAGSRFVSAAEGSGDQVWDEALLKKLTGGDQITARHLYCPYFSYTPAFKLMVSSNESPRLRGQGYAIKRRVRIIPFRARFYDPQDGLEPVRDPDLLTTLLGELPGILNWALAGCLEWHRDGLGLPKAVRAETDKLFCDQDPLLEWLDENCDFIDLAATPVGALWSDYRSWCGLNNREPGFKTTQYFSRSLAQRDGIESHRTNRSRILVGLQLKQAGEATEAEFKDLFSDGNDWEGLGK